MAIHKDIPVEQAERGWKLKVRFYNLPCHVGSRDARNSLSGGVAKTQAAVANSQLAVRQVQMLAAFSVILVLRSAVENSAHVLQVALSSLHGLQELKC
jgi:hypothetical protein